MSMTHSWSSFYSHRFNSSIARIEPALTGNIFTEQDLKEMREGLDREIEKMSKLEFVDFRGRL
jgi:hypothetical protein